MLLSRRSAAPALLVSSLLLVAGCSQAKEPASTHVTTVTRTRVLTSTQPVPGSTSGGQAAVVRPAKDTFTVCDTKLVAKDAAGLSRCTSTSHTTPGTARTITCLGDLAAPRPLTLHVTYSVFKDGRNIANQHVVPAAALTAKSFQYRYDFKPADVGWTGATLPPGSYYCEWYDAAGTRVGNVDLIHGQLASSTVGTPGNQW